MLESFQRITHSKEKSLIFVGDIGTSKCNIFLITWMDEDLEKS